mgnify:FL=1
MKNCINFTDLESVKSLQDAYFQRFITNYKFTDRISGSRYWSGSFWFL